MISFTKMHGLGNDYIYIYDYHQSKENVSSLAKKISHRRYGVGADGIVLINPIQTKLAKWEMQIYNADGSIAETCGNALRCVGKYLWDRKLAPLAPISVATLAGIITMETTDTTLPVNKIKVQMGIPSFLASSVANNQQQETIEQPISFQGIDSPLQVSFASMGNPHTITFVKDLQSYPVTTYGPIIEKDPIFIKKTNVAFIEIINEQHIKQRTWERGSGETWACGSAACAAVAVGIRTKKLISPVRVSLTGGDLTITWNGKDSISKEGSATEVFQGRLTA